MRAGSASFGSGSRCWVETESPRSFSSEANSRPVGPRFTDLRVPPLSGGDPAPDGAPEAECLPLISNTAPAKIGSSYSALAVSGSARLSATSLLFSGAEPPPRPAASMKADKAGCRACLQNLREIRTATNRQFAMRKLKRSRPKVSISPAPQHTYNTRGSKRHKRKQKARKKRNRPVSPPLQGPEIPGVNFPT